MIVTRTPLRISIGGGGTDLPSYYRRDGGTVISAAIDKYVYLAVNQTFTQDYLLKYSELERVTAVADIDHDLIREVLTHLSVGPGIEIVSVADIPSGTGLGSSGSFTVGLILALNAFLHRQLTPQDLAELACHIEIEKLGDPVGKQDQYIASYGGLTRFEFRADDTVDATTLTVDPGTLDDLEDHLLLFFTGYARRATDILADQKAKSEQDDGAMIANLDYVNELGRRIGGALQDGRTHDFADLMHEHWEHKRKRTSGISSGEIDEWYQLARDNGARGGKLVGAGAGGFLMFYAEDPARVRDAMATAGLPEVRFGFDFDGAVVLREELTVLACLVLGGGKGTRMWPATELVPKPLLPVGGVPFAIRQLTDLAARGVTDVVYSIGYLGDQIRATLAAADLGCSVRFVDEGEDLLGTGGATRLAVDDGALGDAFFVLYGDSFLPIDLAAVARAFDRTGAEALMTVYRNDGAWDTSNVVLGDGYVLRYDKDEPDPGSAGMHHIDYGLSILRAETVIERIPPGRPSDLAAMFHDLSEQGRLAAYEATERFFEIGSPRGLADLESHFGARAMTLLTADPDISLLVPDNDVDDPVLSIVIPALNEELTVTDFVQWCQEGLAAAGVVGEILIVDSSDDRTAERALAGGARVLRTPRRGLGAAYLDAFPYVRGEWIIMGDADCTYDFRRLTPFVEGFEDGYEYVMGSRWKGSIEDGSMPALHRYFGTPLTTFILNVVYSSRFSDIHCGMRGITKDALERMNLQSQSWEYASEMVLKSVHMELRTTEVPVTFLKDRDGRESHHKREGWLSPFKAAWINLQAMFVYGSHFFLLKPGLVMMIIGLLLTVPLTFTDLDLGFVTLSLNTQFLGTAILAIGCQAFFMGTIAQVLFDYTGRATKRWASIFPYTRTVLIAFGLIVGGLAATIPLIISFSESGFLLERANTVPNHLAVTGLAAVITGTQLFGFTLVLLGTIIVTTRGRPRPANQE